MKHLRYIQDAWGPIWEPVKFIFLTMLALAFLSGCAYVDAAHMLKEEGKVRMSMINDHYATDVADLARTIPVGALARMPAGERKCALASLVGLRLVECQYVVVPGYGK